MNEKDGGCGDGWAARNVDLIEYGTRGDEEKFLVTVM